jgi:hypothetical protein
MAIVGQFAWFFLGLPKHTKNLFLLGLSIAFRLGLGVGLSGRCPAGCFGLTPGDFSLCRCSCRLGLGFCLGHLALLLPTTASRAATDTSPATRRGESLILRRRKAAADDLRYGPVALVSR